MNLRALSACLLTAALLCGASASAVTREWKTGLLLDTEQQQVKTGSTTFFNSDSESRNKNGKRSSSDHTTATKSDDVDTFEVYTVQGHNKTFVAREKLYFPWSKPAKVTVGSSLKFVIEGNKMIILDEDQKEHKASVVKTSLNAPQ